VLPRKEKDDETDQMMWHNYDQNKGGGVVDSCEACVDNFLSLSLSLSYLYKNKNAHNTKQ